jgi:hypothetical protein
MGPREVSKEALKEKFYQPEGTFGKIFRGWRKLPSDVI